MAEKYQRIKVLGKGSFGKAYLVKNTEDDCQCVVKQMETSMMDPKERNEAVKEALLLKKMDHPNIVRFQEVFMTRKGRLCIVMDYADGGDVHQEIKRQGSKLIEENRILEWFVQTCFALKHVHGRKVLHRDLKTQNIFLMATGQIKLGDFGIAKVLDATKEYAKTMVGTPYYLSPEIIEDRPYNFKSDIWSTGVVLYEMTTLKHPFDADSLVTLASKILKDQFPLPDENMYSQDLVGLIKKMLRKDAAVRPMVDTILSSPFLQAKMHETNNNYGLGLDLAEFATAFVAPLAPMTPVAEEPVASPAASPAPALVAAVAAAPAGAGDTVLMGSMPPQPPAEPPAEKNDGGDASEYEEEFEDYSGSEDGDKPAQNALQQSVAKLRLGPGPTGSESAAPVSASSGMVAAGESSSGTRIGGKAESLRNYLCAQLTKEIFDVAYALVRGASGEGVPAETLQQQVGEVIGADKAPELFTLFQLLCFLEDVTLNDSVPAP